MPSEVRGALLVSCAKRSTSKSNPRYALSSSDGNSSPSPDDGGNSPLNVDVSPEGRSLASCAAVSGEERGSAITGWCEGFSSNGLKSFSLASLSLPSAMAPSADDDHADTCAADEGTSGSGSKVAPLLAMAAAAWLAKTVKKRASSAVKDVKSSSDSPWVPVLSQASLITPPPDLLMSCATPITVPFLVLIGTQRMLSVLNPVSLSTAWLNRASAYASAMSTVSPEVATCPAMPAPRGMRISPPVELTWEKSCWLALSTRNTEATSAPISVRASSTMRRRTFSVFKSALTRTEAFIRASKHFIKAALLPKLTDLRDWRGGRRAAFRIACRCTLKIF
mmetsp:Transcript_10105/g.20232  ORF Transcript_10105/g.20232 Transcript_10105/m.20232 type:complete len:336 (-) Transcript_10105:346-1353(-)